MTRIAIIALLASCSVDQTDCSKLLAKEAFKQNIGNAKIAENEYLVCLEGRREKKGVVAVIDSKGEFQWKIKGLDYPTHAQLLANGNVLVAEKSRSPWWHQLPVTEFNRNGDVVWRHEFNKPLNCYRLADGRTMIAGERGLIVVTRDHKEQQLYDTDALHQLIRGACVLPDGGYALIRSNYPDDHTLLVEVNDNAEVIRETKIPNGAHGALEALPNGHLLIPIRYRNKVIELNREREIVWTCTAVKAPVSAQRLAKGITLIACESTCNPAKGDVKNSIVKVSQMGQVLEVIKLKRNLRYASQPTEYSSAEKK